MAGGINEALHDRINRKIHGHVIINLSACSIFKVPNPLRELNEKGYEPHVISIGPYHHGKEHLKAMEVQKVNSLKLLLGRTRENTVERYVTALEEMEEEARKFYSEPLDHIGRKEFVEMMLLDGCFIIELIFHSTTKKLLTKFYLRKAMRDLLLVENQLPFSVLSKLYSLSSCLPLDIAKDRMAEKVIRFFGGMMPGSPINALTQNQDVEHLLGLLHDLSYSSEEVKSPHELIDMFSPEMVVQQCSAAIVSFPRSCDLTKWQFIRSATELNEAGVKFQKNQGKLFDIKFENEVMSIPTLAINDGTESILRNLVAYEQYYKGISSKCFTDYITFMDCLISTGKDVELLCRSGVLDNWLGDNEVVATMFNGLRNSVLISEAHFFYPEVLIRVNEHCNRKWNLWKANLWHNYFNTPWALISFIAAAFLLLATLLQTLFSLLSYHHQSV